MQSRFARKAKRQMTLVQAMSTGDEYTAPKSKIFDAKKPLGRL